MRYRLSTLLSFLSWPALAASTTLDDGRNALLALPADGRASTVVSLPLAEGDTSPFTVVDSRTVPRELMRRHPGLRSFRGTDAQGRSVRLDLARDMARLHVRRPDGTWEPARTIATEPTAAPVAVPETTVVPAPGDASGRHTRQRRALTQGNVHYDFRLALAAGSHFVDHHGGTPEAALGALTHMVNRANEVLEVDLGVHLTLAAKNDRLFVTDREGDPLEFGEPRTAAVEFIRRRLPAGAYDLGHSLTRLDGGESETGTVCSDALDADYLGTHKASASSGGVDDDGAFTNFLLVLGNQLGAPFRDNRCWACHAFDGPSIERVRTWLASRGGRCGKQRLATGMAAWIDPDSLAEPQVIPAHTPFWLEAAVTPGTPGRRLSYAWDDDSFEPRIRSIGPRLSPRREFTTHLPERSGWLDFRLTVRDNAGADSTFATGGKRLQVIDTGRAFAMEPVASALAGGPLAVRWDPAGTTAEPISCHFLDALLSVDDGASWQTLANYVPNNGAAVLTLPADTRSEGARLRLACDWHPFYAESPAPFAIR